MADIRIVGNHFHIKTFGTLGDVACDTTETNQTQRSAIGQRARPSCEGAQRGDRQREQQQPERPLPGLVREFLDGIGAERIAQQP